MAVKRKGKITWQELELPDMPSVSDERIQIMDALADWWMQDAAIEAANTIPKAIQYGSSSLMMVGEMLHSIAPDLKDSVSAQELAITFYVFGKMARVLAAIERGEQPSMDHWRDIGVYTRMISYIRENGSWV